MLPATDKNLRNFGYVMAAALLVLLGLHFWKGNPEHRAVIAPSLSIGAALFAGLAFVAPQVLRFVYKPWMTMAHYLGIVMTSILMTVFFFTLLVPFTAIRFKDPLRIKRGGSTYWEPYKNPEPTLDRFRRAF